VKPLKESPIHTSFRVTRLWGTSFTGTLTGPKLTSWQSARSNFQDSFNTMYIYGTASAWHAASRLAAVLPSTGEKIGFGHDDHEFVIRYDAFLKILCRDANSSLPSQCR
jgi:hypothetical protein